MGINLPFRPRLIRPRLFIPILLIILLIGIYHLHLLNPPIPQHHIQNTLQAHTPSFLHPLILYFNPHAHSLPPPTLIPSLLNAPWAGSWEFPTLTPPMYSFIKSPSGQAIYALTSPALIMLHFFSTPSSSSRVRRNLIRNHSPLKYIPGEYHHLFEIRFILGYNQVGREEEVEAEEKEIEREMERYGDIVRLEGLEGGENMNQGKSIDWLRWVGERERVGYWVFKIDGDTVPILPNLIPILLSLDERDPTYIGSSVGRWPGYHYYMTGMMYGFSWGVAKTMAEAKLERTDITINWDEDARIGELMYTLPSKPSCQNSTSPSCNPANPPPGGWTSPPPSPDPRTGLKRVDLGWTMGDHLWTWYVAGAERAVAWHGLKSEEDYTDAYQHIMTTLSVNGRDMWNPPRWFERLADRQNDTTIEAVDA